MSVVSKMKITSDTALKKVGLALVVLGLCGAFIRLGIWQLDRAADLKELQKPYIEQPLIALTDVATPSTNLSDSAINRIVTLSGRYIAHRLHPTKSASFHQNPSTHIDGWFYIDHPRP